MKKEPFNDNPDRLELFVGALLFWGFLYAIYLTA